MESCPKGHLSSYPPTSVKGERGGRRNETGTGTSYLCTTLLPTGPTWGLRPRYPVVGYGPLVILVGPSSLFVCSRPKRKSGSLSHRTDPYDRLLSRTKTPPVGRLPRESGDVTTLYTGETIPTRTFLPRSPSPTPTTGTDPSVRFWSFPDSLTSGL